MASQISRSDDTRVSSTKYVSGHTEVILDLSYSYCDLRPHLYLSADDIALIEEARLANGYGRSCSDAAVHGTLDGRADDTLDGISDGTPDDTPDDTPNDTPDGSSVVTSAAIDYHHGFIDAEYTGGFDAQRDACCGLHDVDHFLEDLQALCDYASPSNDEYPPRLEMGDEDDEAAERRHQLPNLVRILDPVFASNCATESLGCVEVRVGWYGCIPRWRKGSELSYIVCTESFPEPLAGMVEAAMKEAISMWQGVCVSFKQVSSDSEATFDIRYDGGIGKTGYACSFLPRKEPAELLVHEKSLSKVEYLPNILAHEVGHILGLRHEFANKREGDNPSVLFGSEDDRSVMLYYDHPSKHKVTALDLQGLKEFYDFNKAEYHGLPIVDIEPELHNFGKANTSRHAMRE